MCRPMSPLTRKPVFGVSDQIRYKSGCTASHMLEIVDIETRISHDVAFCVSIREANIIFTASE